MGETQPGSAAATAGGLGTDDATLTEVVQPSFVCRNGLPLAYPSQQLLQYLLVHRHNFSFANNVSSSVERSRMARFFFLGQFPKRLWLCHFFGFFACTICISTR